MRVWNEERASPGFGTRSRRRRLVGVAERRLDWIRPRTGMALSERLSSGRFPGGLNRQRRACRRIACRV